MVSIVAALVTLPFLVRLDLWLFEHAVLWVRPWILMVLLFAPFILACAVRSVVRPVATFRWDAVGLGVAVLLVGIVEVSGVGRWMKLPAEVQVLLFYWLNLFTFLSGYCIARTLGSRIGLRRMFGLSLAVVTLSVVADWLWPGLLSEISLGGRSAGFVGNPNGAAFVASTLLIGVVDWERPLRGWWQAGAVGGALVVVVLSGSRGGVATMAAVLGALWVRAWAMAPRTEGGVSREVGAILVIGSMAIGGLAIAWVSGSRLLDVLWGDFLSDYAAQQRFLALDTSWELIARAPILGHGTGYASTMDVGPHNLLLRIWIENGVPGVAAYGSLWGVLMYMALSRGNWGLGTLGVVSLVMGMVSHNVTEDRTLILSLGMLVAMRMGKEGVRLHEGQGVRDASPS